MECGEGETAPEGGLRGIGFEKVGLGSEPFGGTGSEGGGGCGESAAGHGDAFESGHDVARDRGTNHGGIAVEDVEGALPRGTGRCGKGT